MTKLHAVSFAALVGCSETACDMGWLTSFWKVVRNWTEPATVVAAASSGGTAVCIQVKHTNAAQSMPLLSALPASIHFFKQ